MYMAPPDFRTRLCACVPRQLWRMVPGST